jgi:hypothetical protein
MTRKTATVMQAVSATAGNATPEPEEANQSAFQDKTIGLVPVVLCLHPIK